MSNRWICSPDKEAYAGALRFVKEVEMKKPLQSASLKMTALGVYEVCLDGEKVGKRIMAPGFTSYNHRGIQLQEYDLTELLRGRERAELSAVVAPGWAVGHIGYSANEHIYGERVALWAELTLIYADWTADTLVTDGSWQVFTHEVTFADIYHGITVDKSLVPVCLGKAVPAEVNWQLVPDLGEEVREQEILTARLIRTPKGEQVLDFGQNLTGYVYLKIKGERGKQVRLSFGEVLDKEGNFYNENYRGARNAVTYILSGGEDEFRCRFTYQGFRLVRVDEYPEEEVDPCGFRAVVLHSDMKRTGYFSCGDPKVNQLFHNVVWGQKSNYLDIPTDCPQRDERLGWTGDAQVFCRTAALNYDVRKFFAKWLADLRAEQGEKGEILGTCPETFGITEFPHTKISAAWGDACVIIPYTLYRQYGDKRFLADNYDMMCRWVEFIRQSGPEEYLWLGGDHYGDWCAMDNGEDNVFGATSADLIASAFYARSTEMVIKAGEALGRDTSGWRDLYAHIRKAYRAEFLEQALAYEVPAQGKPDLLGGRMTQTALTLALHFGLCEEEERPLLTEKLAGLIRLYDGKMTTGFVGTPYLLHVLSDNGRSDLAYHLLLSEGYPSWLYSVNHGATTMWEHWNGIKENGDLWSPTMNSFNHYAYGAVGDWLYGGCAGIRIEEPGYKKVTLAPLPDRRMGWADCTLEIPAGRLETHWKYDREGGVTFDFVIPEGVEATVLLPDGYRESVTGGCYCYHLK